ncbi:MAG: cold-shock protein [Stackebrandtia sp.]
MQGTVATFDSDARSGTVLLDDGTPVSFGSEAFDASTLRMLRLGQRIQLETDGAGVVRRLRLPTMK